MKHQSMRLTIPAREDWALVLRMALAGVGALCDLSADCVDDLRTAGDEAFALLMCQRARVCSVTLECRQLDGELCFSLLADRTQEEQDVPSVDPEIARLIIGTLTRDVQLDTDARGVYCVRVRM